MVAGLCVRDEVYATLKNSGSIRYSYSIRHAAPNASFLTPAGGTRLRVLGLLGGFGKTLPNEFVLHTRQQLHNLEEKWRVERRASEVINVDIIDACNVHKRAAEWAKVSSSAQDHA